MEQAIQVCLEDFQYKIAPPSVKICPLVDFDFSKSVIQFASLYPSSTCGYFQYLKALSLVFLKLQQGIPMIITRITNVSAQFACSISYIRFSAIHQINQTFDDLRILQLSFFNHVFLRRQMCQRRVYISFDPMFLESFYYLVYVID